MVVDIVCGALLLIFGLFGVFKGFARQIFKFASFFAAVIGAFLLVKPAFDFCYALGFGKSWYEAMAGAFNTDGWLGALGKKITDYAASCGKTSGQFWAGIAMNVCLFVALAILLGLAFKILKKIVFPIADMPVIKVFDRILGLILGLFWACLIIVCVILLLDQAIAPNVKAVNDWLVKTKADSPIVGKYLWDYIDKIGYTIYDIVKFICGKIKLA